MNTRIRNRALLLATAILIITTASTRLRADSGACGDAHITLPFTDVFSSNIFFCSIAEAFFSGLTNGTSSTTYNPDDPVSREQMAAFVTRTLDQSVQRASKRAALDQFWTTPNLNFGLTNIGGNRPFLLKSDGVDLWVANFFSGSVSRIRASDGRLLESWTGATSAVGVLVAMGKVFVTGDTRPGRLYQIDPTGPAGAVTTLTSALGDLPNGIAYDGARIWTANAGGSISIVTVNPLSVTTITTGFINPPGIVYDGANIWVTDGGDDTIKRLDAGGAVIASVPTGVRPSYPAFDGTNIWVPNLVGNSVTVVRATGALAGTVLETLTDNGLVGPNQAAFDGERILVTNYGGDSVSLWKASDLTPIGTFPTPHFGPFGVCSDGLNFWVTITFSGQLARF